MHTVKYIFCLDKWIAARLFNCYLTNKILSAVSKGFSLLRLHNRPSIMAILMNVPQWGVPVVFLLTPPLCLSLSHTTHTQALCAVYIPLKEAFTLLSLITLGLLAVSRIALLFPVVTAFICGGIFRRLEDFFKSCKCWWGNFKDFSTAWLIKTV